MLANKKLTFTTQIALKYLSFTLIKLNLYACYRLCMECFYNIYTCAHTYIYGTFCLLICLSKDIDCHLLPFLVFLSTHTQREIIL